MPRLGFSGLRRGRPLNAGGLPHEDQQGDPQGDGLGDQHQGNAADALGDQGNGNGRVVDPSSHQAAQHHQSSDPCTEHHTGQRLGKRTDPAFAAPDVDQGKQHEGVEQLRHGVGHAEPLGEASNRIEPQRQHRSEALGQPITQGFDPAGAPGKALPAPALQIEQEGDRWIEVSSTRATTRMDEHGQREAYQQGLLEAIERRMAGPGDGVGKKRRSSCFDQTAPEQVGGHPYQTRLSY